MIAHGGQLSCCENMAALEPKIVFQGVLFLSYYQKPGTGNCLRHWKKAKSLTRLVPSRSYSAYIHQSLTNKKT